MINRRPYFKTFMFFCLLLLGVTGGIINAVTNQFIPAPKPVMAAYAKCWNVLTDQSDQPVTLLVDYRKDGSIASINMSEKDKKRVDNDYSFNLAANQAKQAVVGCSPNQALKLTDYKHWKKLRVTFAMGDAS